MSHQQAGPTTVKGRLRKLAAIAKVALPLRMSSMNALVNVHEQHVAMAMSLLLNRVKARTWRVAMVMVAFRGKR